MLPVVAIVGRPNVGKSTLFNALTRTRDALVANIPGVTRDRQYGISDVGDTPCVLIDTGGLVGKAEGIDYLTAKQVHQAIEESHLVFFVVSARDGLTHEDEEISQLLRQHDRPVLLVGNKTDGTDTDLSLIEFTALGMGDAVAIAASHRRGVSDLMGEAVNILPQMEQGEDELEEDPERIRLAIVGRPNVGKSTLVNRLLGEERVMAYDQPGTTRDSISTFMEHNSVKYELIDTAGVRRRSRVSDMVEKFSVIKALQAIDRAHVVILMLDASEGITDQDATLLGHILQQGRALVIAMNKWDGMEEYDRKQMLSEMDRRLQYVTWARQIRLSALHGSGLKELIKAVREAWRSATINMPTPELTRILQKAWEAHQPPMSQGRSSRLRFAHSGGSLPPRIIIHGNRTDAIPPSYKRYLENVYIKHFKLRGTPLRIDFRSGENPYKDKKNKLTQRQLAKRSRLKKFTKRKSRK
ncbi:MAG: ribosome biogenesis GTPase Der [Xanthomonadales bacterium]|nr:ribosome biogenesis GTPase Der [Xanthomonadales bacterium]